MAKSKTINPGDRVRILRGPWASDCGTVVKVRRAMLVVEVDTGGKKALVRREYCRKI